MCTRANIKNKPMTAFLFCFSCAFNRIEVRGLVRVVVVCATLRHRHSKKGTSYNNKIINSCIICGFIIISNVITSTTIQRF